MRQGVRCHRKCAWGAGVGRHGQGADAFRLGAEGRSLRMIRDAVGDDERAQTLSRGAGPGGSGGRKMGTQAMQGQTAKDLVARSKGLGIWT